MSAIGETFNKLIDAYVDIETSRNTGVVPPQILVRNDGEIYPQGQYQEATASSGAAVPVGVLALAALGLFAFMAVK